MNNCFKKGKNISTVILYSILIEIIITVLVSVSHAGNDAISLIEFFLALPVLIIVILSPFALFYVIKSYATNVENETQRTWYAMLLVIINFIVFILLLSIGFRIGRLF